MSSWNDWNNDGKRDWKDAVIEHDLAEMSKETETNEHFVSDSADTGFAILVYLIVMIGGAIFHDRWLIWIAATVILVNYLKKK